MIVPARKRVKAENAELPSRPCQTPFAVGLAFGVYSAAETREAEARAPAPLFASDVSNPRRETNANSVLSRRWRCC